MHWIQFLLLSSVIVATGHFLARDGEILGEKSGMGRTWIGAILVAATTSLPELFVGVGASAIFQLPEIAAGDVAGSCMFNLLILSMMDLIAGKAPLSTRASSGHSLSLGFGSLLLSIAAIGIVAGNRVPSLGHIGFTTPFLAAGYLIAARVMSHYERRHFQVAEQLYAHIPLRTVILRYSVAAVAVVAAAIFLPAAGAAIAADTDLDQGFVGMLFIAIATSLPELSVSLAAVRMGSVDLAVGNVLGSNLFNMLILALDDVL